MVKRKIYFRADAGPEIGYGHFIRSLALADMLKQDFDCTMFTQTPTEYLFNEAKDICPVVALPADNSRFDIFLDRLQGDEIVVLDNYFFTTEYQKSIKDKGCKLVCLDGMVTKHYVADVVLNQSLDLQRSDFSIEPYTQLLLGLKYVLLRKPFYTSGETRINKKDDKKTVVIAFGGADPCHLLQEYTSLLNSLPEVGKIVAISPNREMNVSAEKLELKHQVSAEELVKIYLEADFGILPSSTMLKEALACHLPVISGYFVDNQVQTYECYLRHNLIYGIGDFHSHVAKVHLQTFIHAGCSFEAIDFDAAGITSDIPQKYVEIFKSL